MYAVNSLLFDEFTALDLFGAVEVFSRLKQEYKLGYFSLNGGLVKNSINLNIYTEPISKISSYDILLVPGGFGVRDIVNNDEFISNLKILIQKHKYVLSVCTGSVLLSKTGALDSLLATTNKLSWQWAISQNSKTNWVKRARFTKDDKFYTSSGVSAGIDMALAFISDMHTKDVAYNIAKAMEYLPIFDKDNDPFA